MDVRSQDVCNLSVEGLHNFAVGLAGLLVHNDTWCELYEKVSGRQVPKVLEDIVDQGALKSTDGKVLTRKAIHGHHIVMKEAMDKWSVAARKILEDYGVPGHFTKEDLAKANPEEIYNIGFALNYTNGIHGKAYKKAVLERLQGAVELGGTKDQIAERIKEELLIMRDILEADGVFW